MPLNYHAYTFETYSSTDIQFRPFEGPLNPQNGSIGEHVLLAACKLSKIILNCILFYL